MKYEDRLPPYIRAALTRSVEEIKATGARGFAEERAITYLAGQGFEQLAAITADHTATVEREKAAQQAQGQPQGQPLEGMALRRRLREEGYILWKLRTCKVLQRRSSSPAATDPAPSPSRSPAGCAGGWP